MTKADDKFKITDEKGKTVLAPFTEFDLLKREVEFLSELVNELSDILKQNGLYNKIEPSRFDKREVYMSFINSEEDADDDSSEDDDDEEPEKPAKKAKAKEEAEDDAEGEPEDLMDFYDDDDDEDP